MNITFEAPKSAIFTSDYQTEKPDTVLPRAEIADYSGHIIPGDIAACREKGDACADEVRQRFLADFEKNLAYCEKHPEDHVDRMVHVSTFTILDGIIYMTYYANVGTDAEDPSMQEARFAFCPVDDPADITIVRLLGAGDTLDGKTVDRVYDTILLHKDDKILYLMFTASVDGLYYRFYCTYTIATATVGPILPNRFKVGTVTNDFSTSGIITALAENSIPRKEMFSDIGIMQKLTSRVENGETWYYTGTYSGYWNAIIKSTDFITWEYVAAPDFPNDSHWENAVFVRDNKVFYFVRQEWSRKDGFLTYYDLEHGTWAAPCLIRDAQSRSDFIEYEGALYLIHAPIDRNGFGVVRINCEDIGKSEPVLVADMRDSLFYPYSVVYGTDVWMSYTVDRKHIRLSRYDLGSYL